MGVWTDVTLGMIAEDRSDIAVMTVLTAKVLPRQAFSVKHFAAGGCGKLRQKCTAWANNLRLRGCEYIIVVHDLDTASEAELRQDLEGRVRGVAVRASLVLIPVREMEAWLLADAEALRKTFNLKRAPKLPRNPENIANPKEYLGEVVWKSGRKRYVNTLHNERIAVAARLSEVNRCNSFTRLPQLDRKSVV